MPAKLDRCVADVKRTGSADNPWAVCNASIDKSKEISAALQDPTIELLQEKVNENRQVPYFNPPVKKGKVEPVVGKSLSGMGGERSDSANADLWKKILDAQLKRNDREPNSKSI